MSKAKTTEDQKEKMPALTPVEERSLGQLREMVLEQVRINRELELLQQSAIILKKSIEGILIINEWTPEFANSILTK